MRIRRLLEEGTQTGGVEHIMIKAFLARAGRRFRRIAGVGKKKQEHRAEVQIDQPQQERIQDNPELERPAPKKRKKKPRWTLTNFPVDPVEGKSRFHDFSLPMGLMHAIADLEFNYCTPIQEKALPDALAGKDLIARAGTGTGKSAVFLIALFTRLIQDNKKRQRNQEDNAKVRPWFPRA
ncbi:MAG: DEAD/DEAH box helicase, partial [Candidatus Electrothrix sp. AR3]|nr:DEAD/DEAH box helicase [Candidatus Electrothrix sp. AR3]